MRLRDGWVVKTGFRMESSIPSGKESARRGRVDGFRRQPPCELREMPSRVQEHVGQRVPHLARRAEDVQVVTIRENWTAAPEDSIHGACDARGDGFHAAREVLLAGRLDECVNVVVLDRVVNQSEAPALARRSEAALELANQPGRAKRGQVALHLQRDVAGMTPRERCARTMRISRIRAALAARARAPSSPARCRAQIEVELPSASRHRMHCDMYL